MSGILGSFGSGQVHAAIAHGAVETAVGSEGESVEVVAGERDAHPEAVLNDQALVATDLAIAIEVGQGPDVGNAGEVDHVLIREDSGSGSV